MSRIGNEEDKQVVEILRRLDEKYAFGMHQSYYDLGLVLKIEDWCERENKGKPVWERRLPNSKANDENEKKLGLAFKHLRKKIMQYDGIEIEQIENEKDKKVVELLRRLEEE